MWVGGHSVHLADAATSRRHHTLLGQAALACTCAPTGSPEKKEHPFSHNVSRELRSSIFLAPGSPSFWACVDCAFSQRPPGKLLFLCLFHFYFFILLVFFISYLIPANTRNIWQIGLYKEGNTNEKHTRKRGKLRGLQHKEKTTNLR